MRAVSLIVLFLVLGLPALCQPHHYSLRNYKAVDGLPQSQVRALIEDKNGYVWVGTEGGGLARFDGSSFRVYTTLDGLQSNIVWHLMLDRHDNLWIVHPRGITKFNGTTFQKFQQPGSPETTSRLRRTFLSGDSILFLSAPGYYGKIFNDSVHFWSKPLKQSTVHPGKPALISFVREGPSGELIFCIDRKELYVRTASDAFTVPFPETYEEISSVFNYKNAFWLSTDKGMRKLEISKREIVPGSLPVEHTVLHYDEVRDAFWTFKDTKLFQEKLKGGKWIVETVMPDIQITSVLTDSEGNTWLGTNGGGLFKYFVQDFDRCASDRITHVMAIHKDSKGDIWMGTTTKGLFRTSPGAMKAYSHEGEMRGNSIYDIAESPEGELFLGGSSGLARYNRKADSFEWEPSGRPREDGVFNIQFSSKGEMWLSRASYGIEYREKGKTKRKFDTKSGLRTSMISAMHYSERYKKLYFGDEFGLGCIQDTTVSLLDIGFENTSVLTIYPFRDSLLVLSTAGSGVIVYNPKTGSSRAITRQDGLASDFIYFSAADDDGLLWVGSEKGITKARLSDDLKVLEHLHYDYENGLVGVETNQNAFCFFDDTRLFGLIDGLYVYNDPPVKGESIFPLHLTAVELFYGEISVDEYAKGKEGFFNIPTGLSLPPDKNHITFKFNRVDKRNRKSMKFRYLLQGFDKTWSQPSSSSEVTYSNLPPGVYSLLVLSSDSKGGWTGRPLRYDFEIRTPFYARSEFIISAIVLTAAAIALILFLRVRQRVRHVMMLQKIRLKEQETVRRDIARDFHDEMGNQLSRIINYVSLLKLNGRNGSTRNEDLYTKVEESAKYLYTGTRDFIWSIDPGNDELSKLFLHIRDFGEKLFEEKQIKFRAINLVKDKIKLPYGFSREANLIFKEAMTNAFKYSQACNVTFSLKPEGDSFLMCLEDDGIGFAREACSRKEGGLKNLLERSERINVQLKVDSEPEKGTRVSIQFSAAKKVQYGLTI